jgi:ABC-type phosphate/phosphonate transport system permease subunit
VLEKPLPLVLTVLELLWDREHRFRILWGRHGRYFGLSRSIDPTLPILVPVSAFRLDPFADVIVLGIINIQNLQDIRQNEINKN